MTPPVEVLVCGTIDRGDDGAPSVAAALLEAALPPNIRIKTVGQLDVDDLLGIPADSGVVIVDAAAGIEPGAVVELPLRGLISRGSEIQPRSSHALAMPEVIGLADMLRGRPLAGRVVVIGARTFRLGRPLTRRVRASIPALQRAVELAASHVSEAIRAEHDSAAPRRGR